MYLHTYRKELKYRGLQWRIVPVTPEVEGSSPFRTAKQKAESYGSAFSLLDGQDEYRE